MAGESGAKAMKNIDLSFKQLEGNLAVTTEVLETLEATIAGS
jgi:hypothetical protein